MLATVAVSAAVQSNKRAKNNIAASASTGQRRGKGRGTKGGGSMEVHQEERHNGEQEDCGRGRASNKK